MKWGEGGLSAILSAQEKSVKLVALKEAKDLVWADLSDDLEADTDFMDAKRVYIGGGGSLFWGDYLADLCQAKADILAPVRKEIKSTFAKDGIAASLQQRLMDLYLVWRQNAVPMVPLLPTSAKEVA